MTGSEDPQRSRGATARDRFGLLAAGCAVVLYAAATVFFVLPLAHKLDTFLIVSYLFVPAIVGGLVYDRIDRSGGWR